MNPGGDPDGPTPATGRWVNRIFEALAEALEEGVEIRTPGFGKSSVGSIFLAETGLVRGLDNRGQVS